MSFLVHYGVSHPQQLAAAYSSGCARTILPIIKPIIIQLSQRVTDID